MQSYFKRSSKRNNKKWIGIENGENFKLSYLHNRRCDFMRSGDTQLMLRWNKENWKVAFRQYFGHVVYFGCQFSFSLATFFGFLFSIMHKARSKLVQTMCAFRIRYATAVLTERLSAMCSDAIFFILFKVSMRGWTAKSLLPTNKKMIYLSSWKSTFYAIINICMKHNFSTTTTNWWWITKQNLTEKWKEINVKLYYLQRKL